MAGRTKLLIKAEASVLKELILVLTHPTSQEMSCHDQIYWQNHTSLVGSHVVRVCKCI